jgi:hypothetical protein
MGSIMLNYHASEVRMVLGGSGTVVVTVGDATQTIRVSGTPKSYQLVLTDAIEKGTLEVSVSEGVEAYSFTFG